MSVQKRGKVFYMAFTVHGKRIFRSTGKVTKREARAVEAAERQKLLKESKLSPQERAARATLKDAIEVTYNSKWKNNKDAKGTHRRALRLLELIGNVPVGNIHEDMVDDLIRTLEATGIEGATINRYLTTLKTIMKQMKQPVDYIKMRKESRGRLRIVTRNEELQVISLLSQSEKPVYQEVGDLVVVLIDSGMRLSEALDLRYEDVNFTSNLIHIWKNKASRPRSIPMTRRVKGILKGRQEANPLKPFAITKYQADKAWVWARKQMGLEGEAEFLLHSLRHTFASRLLNLGISLATIRDLLGHASTLTTERVYAHLCPTKLAHAVKVLEED